MINQILTNLAPTFQTINWIDQYAGLTRIATRQTESGAESYPISCNVTQAECWKSHRYKDLVPDDKYDSVAYWEQITGLKPIADTTRGRISREMINMEANIRLIGWFNLQKLGKTDCDFTQQALTDALKTLHNQTFQNSIYKRIKFTFLEQETREQTKRIFQKYAYGNKEALFSYPYETTSIIFKINFAVNPSCVDLTTNDDPIECITL